MTEQVLEEIKDALSENIANYCIGTFEAGQISCEHCRCVKRCKMLQKLLTNNREVI